MEDSRKATNIMLLAMFMAMGAVVLSVIVAPTKTIASLESLPTNAISQVKVDADGDLYERFSGSFASYETWLDSGNNTQVWVERTIISGTLVVDAGTGRLACTTDRIFGISRVTVGTDTTVIDLDFYDASSGGSLLDTQRVTLTAEILP